MSRPLRGSDGVPGTLRFVHDVSIESVDGHRVAVLADTPFARRESLVLEMPGELGMRTCVDVSVVSSLPLLEDGPWRWRVLLVKMPPSSAAWGTGRPVPAVSQGEMAVHLPALGVIVRRLRVQVRERAGGGCAVESTGPVPAEGIARLEVESRGLQLVEAVRLSATRRETDSPRWTAKAEYLASNGPVSRTVRNLLARFEIMDELSARGRDSEVPPRSMAETLI